MLPAALPLSTVATCSSPRLRGHEREVVVLSLKLSQHSKQLPVADLVAVLQEQGQRGHERVPLVDFQRVGGRQTVGALSALVPRLSIVLFNRALPELSLARKLLVLNRRRQ